MALNPYRVGRYTMLLPVEWPPLLHKTAPAKYAPAGAVEVHPIDGAGLRFTGTSWGPEVTAVMLLPSVALRAMCEGGPTWPSLLLLKPRVATCWPLKGADRLNLTIRQRWVGEVAVLPLQSLAPFRMA